MTFWHCTRDAAFIAKYGNFHLPRKSKCILGWKMVCYLQVQEFKIGILLDENKSFCCGCLFAGIIGTQNVRSCYVQRRQSALLLACTFVLGLRD